MADIFLSYAKEDREVARKIATLLGNAGWVVWWDRRIPAGRTWRSVLEEALRDMRCMVVLWSTHSIESDWVRDEADEARAPEKVGSGTNRSGQPAGWISQHSGGRPVGLGRLEIVRPAFNSYLLIWNH